MNIKVLTLFPDMFHGFLNTSIIKNAREKNIFSIDLYNIRDFSENKHKKVDDYPYGGGPGMVMTPGPIKNAYNEAMKNISKDTRVIYMTPRGKVFNQKMAIDLSKESHLVFLCGHYEGIDERVLNEIVTDEVSIGDYVLTGGELPTMVIIDSVLRMVKGVIKEDSFKEESFYNGLLEHPHYTRPREYNNQKVPDVLLSGDHKKINKWREEESIKITKKNRPDLLK